MPRKKKKSKSSKEVKELRDKLNTVMKKLEETSASRLDNNVEELNEQLDKLVSVNMNLQSKMTELLIKVTDLVRENRELVNLLEEASEEEYVEENKGFNADSLLVELKKIESNTKGLKDENKKLINYIKKLYTKSLLGRAIKGRIQPTREEEGQGSIPLPGEEENVSDY